MTLSGKLKPYSGIAGEDVLAVNQQFRDANPGTPAVSASPFLRKKRVRFLERPPESPEPPR